MVENTELVDGVLFVGDLHLYNREIRSTQGMIENNVIMLENLYKYIESNEYIKVVIFLGDIQHLTPYGKNTLEETSKWKYWLLKIGKLMRTRLTRGLKVKLRNEEVNNYDNSLSFVEQLKRNVMPLFTLRGNHDTDKDGSHTFFDYCIKQGILINPEKIIYGDTQYNFHNYGELTRQYREVTSIERVVGLFHDTIPSGDSESWMLFEFEKKYPNLSVDDIVSRLDLAVVGHIHKKLDPIYHVFEDETKKVRQEDPIIWYTGSVGRTSIEESQMRDIGYCGYMERDRLDMIASVEIDVMPRTDYFNFPRIVEQRERQEQEQQFTNFRLGQEEVIHSDNKTPFEVITESVEDENVRETCLAIMGEVMNNED